MGRVIKCSAESEDRYTLAVPSLVVPLPPRIDADGEFDDVEPVACEAPAAPAVDFEALAAQGQQIIDDAMRRAQAIEDDAHTLARSVHAQAEIQAQTAVEQARRAAYDDGYAGGAADANIKMAGMIDTLRELVEAARTQRHALLVSAEPELVRLAVGIAERVLHQQIALDPGVVVEMAKAAISRIVDREKITVRVNPGDVDRMREHRDELLALGDVKTMQVIEDQRVDRGGVILETDGGSIDAKISTQLSEVRKILHIVDDVVVQPAQTAAEADEYPPVAARAS